MAKSDRKIPKIDDVAALAGVSIATVSRTLAMPDKVRQETRDLVMRAVQSTGYVPNLAARNLRLKRSRTVLAVLPDGTNMFFPRILRGVTAALSQRGYTLIVADTENDPARERRYADFVTAGQVDGVLLLNGRMLPLPRARRAARILPMVSLCERIPDSGLPHVETKNRESARVMTSYLISLGHRRIGYVRGPAANVLEHERFAGYVEALRQAGLPFDEDLVRPGDFTIGAGEAAARAFLSARPRPDAIFACNDAMAMGVVRVLAAAGVAVPRSMSVAGFDDIEYADAYNPGLTTMRQARRDIGVAAASMLLDLIEGKDLADDEVRLDAELVIRESTALRAPS